MTCIRSIDRTTEEKIREDSRRRSQSPEERAKHQEFAVKEAKRYRVAADRGLTLEKLLRLLPRLSDEDLRKVHSLASARLLRRLDLDARREREGT